MSAYLGGMAVTQVGWAGPNSIDVRFTTPHTGWLYQLYAGRVRIGTTIVPSERRIVGQLRRDPIPTPLTVLRVSPGDRLTDFGPQLPRWPWNRFKLNWSVAGYPADTRHFDVLASPAAGEPVDAENLVGRVLFRGDGAYEFLAPPVRSNGEWIYRVAARDGTYPAGNLGADEDVTIDALVIPPDVTPDSSGNRFSLSVSAGSLIAAFTY